MHYRWLKGGPAEPFLFPLRELGLQVLEFTLDSQATDWPTMRALAETCLQLGFELSFHLPYKGRFNPAGFSSARREALEQALAPVMSFITGISAKQGDTAIVVHGAKGTDSRAVLQRDTIAFMSWILERSASLHLFLELRTRQEGISKVGDTKEELVSVVSTLNSSRAGICWDLGHDKLNGLPSSSEDFLSWVRHTHVHDVSPAGEDHLPLLYGNVPYDKALDHLMQKGFDGVVLLEVNGHFIADMEARTGRTSIQILRESFGALRAKLEGN
jgi:sugar phosphate isomerase/epimerase